MQLGAAMFFTDYSMTPAELGRALEERGFDSVWAPEHSHIPVTRASAYPQGGDLPKRYYDVMDPFVTLTAAAMVSGDAPSRKAMPRLRHAPNTFARACCISGG